jgi:multicomponent Na+:H+ antiporter subunit A
MLFSMVLLCLLIAPLSLVIRRSLRSNSEWVLALIPLLLFGLFFRQLGSIPMVESYTWVGDLGTLTVELMFRLDALSLILALLVSGMGTFAVIHAGGAPLHDWQGDLVLAHLLSYIGAMLGLVLAGNIWTLLVFWMLTIVCSYLLLGYQPGDARVRHAAQHALLVPAGGWVCLVGGLLLLTVAAQSAGVPTAEAADFAAIVPVGDSIVTLPVAGPLTVLTIVGCMALAGQIPLHGWLPHSARAPIPMRAILHTVILVLAGVYLLARLYPVLNVMPIWGGLLSALGAGGFVVGAAMALCGNDVKPLLIYHLVSQVGLMVMLVGLGGVYAPLTLAAMLLAHVPGTGALFLLVGIVIRRVGASDLRQLGQLYAAMPVTAWLSMLVALSLAGMPLFFGFIVQKLLFATIIESSLPGLVRAGLWLMVVVGVALKITYLWRLIRRIFFGITSVHALSTVREAPATMLFGPAILTALLLVFGVGGVGQNAATGLLEPAASVIAGATSTPVTVSLNFWEGGILPLLSVSVVFVLGAAGVFYEHRVVALLLPLATRLTSLYLYENALQMVHITARYLTRLFQQSSLRTAIGVSVMMWLALVGPMFVAFGLDTAEMPGLVELWHDLFLHEIVLALLVLVGIDIAIRARSPLGGLVGVALVGVVVSLFFLMLSAPDLALTHMLAMVFIGVFLLRVFGTLPARSMPRVPQGTRLRDGLIALGVGILMATLTFVVATYQPFERVASFDREAAALRGRETNMIQMILVDFRSLDTFVVMVALLASLLGAYGLIRQHRSQRTASLQRQRAEGARQQIEP